MYFAQVTNAWFALEEALALCPTNHRARFLLVEVYDDITKTIDPFGYASNQTFRNNWIGLAALGDVDD